MKEEIERLGEAVRSTDNKNGYKMFRMEIINGKSQRWLDKYHVNISTNEMAYFLIV